MSTKTSNFNLIRLQLLKKYIGRHIFFMATMATMAKIFYLLNI